jgi:molecular chaperone DnaK
MLSFFLTFLSYDLFPSFSTAVDNQPTAMKVNEGRRNSNHLGEFGFAGIPPAAKGIPHIEVTFELDVNMIYHDNQKR